MHLTSLKDCRLAIGNYPFFTYDATGGGGNASVIDNEKTKCSFLKFDPKKFYIPPLSGKTAKILGLPMLPGLEIKMVLGKLEGVLDTKNGEIILDFEARFILQILKRLRFPDLIIKTQLKSGEVNSRLHKVKGQNKSEDGSTKLVGVAIVPPSGNKFLDMFLGLPNEALAILECRIK